MELGKREPIIIVDDDIANLKAGKAALSKKYDVLTLPSAAKMFEVLPRVSPPLILLDVDMPDMDGYEALKMLQGHEDTRKIPVIFLTGKTDHVNELEGLRLGAVDYISKPFLPELLMKRVEVRLSFEEQRKQLEEYSAGLLSFNETLQDVVEQKAQSMRQLQSAILQTVADLVERRDGNTGGHIERTQSYLRILITALQGHEKYGKQIETWDVDLLVHSSQLHDVGKISISDAILKKPGKLTPEEFGEMKKHTTYGEEIIEEMMSLSVEKDFLRYAKELAATHHERWDGTGYHRGLAGEDIPLSGRLMSIADVYDALVSERPYKHPFTHEEAVQIIVDGKGTQFDPTLVDVFEQLTDKFAAVSSSIINNL